jgi:hypothetical protein
MDIGHVLIGIFKHVLSVWKTVCAMQVMLQCDSPSFLEFMGTRVREIKSISSTDKDWFWILTDCNLSDSVTRPNVEPWQLTEDLDYQNGLDLMPSRRLSGQ